MITEQIIDDSYIYKNLGKIFPNSIVLRTDYEIVAVNSDLEILFKYEPGMLIGQNVLKIFRKEISEFDKYAHELIEKGYFKSKPFSASDRKGKEIHVELSGFYLGLISDFNDLLILIVNDLRKAKNYKDQILERENIFQQLVYRTYHDIKGPIATIKGLTSLCDKAMDDAEKKQIVKLINDSASMLDERITHISQFYEINRSQYNQPNDINLNSIEKEAHNILNNNKSYNKISFNLKASDILSMNENGGAISQTIFSFLRGTTLFKVNNISPSISLEISKFGSDVKLIFILTSHSVKESLKERMIKADFNMENAIKEESILRFYILRNQVHNLRGKINYTFRNNELTRCEILIPITC